MVDEHELREQICEVGRRIYNRRMAAANDGNISSKLGENEWLCTPTGVSKGFMTPDMICKVDAKGEPLEESAEHRPSSEIKMHMRVYGKRSDVGAVVHAHPVYATSFAVAGIPLTRPITPEAVIFLGCVPIVEYGMPSTIELADNLEKYLEHHDAVLLESHGALTWGRDVIKAYHTMESLEFYAELMHHSGVLGGARELSGSQVNRLYELRKELGLQGRHPAEVCRSRSGPGCHRCRTAQLPPSLPASDNSHK